ncbi:MAG: ARMT1-like domain-containing protein [Velocimicrobium sp.]
MGESIDKIVCRAIQMYEAKKVSLHKNTQINVSEKKGRSIIDARNKDLNVPFWPKSALSGYRGMNQYDPYFGETFYNDSFHGNISHEEMLKKICCETVIMKVKTNISDEGILLEAMSEEDVENMKMHDKCLPCIINQVIKVANITEIEDKEELLREVFTYLSKMNFDATTPEIIGEIFDMIKKYTNNPDPYKETRDYYNSLFLQLLPEFERKIYQAEKPFELAVRYAIVGNIIDFNPIHNTLLEDIYDYFDKMDQLECNTTNY